MPHTDYDCNLGCPVERALEIIGGKWKGAILYHLLDSSNQDTSIRFNELRRIMPNITQRMLTKQLRELEEIKLISRTIHPEVPPRVEYAMTDYGKTLAPVIESLRAWGISHLESNDTRQD
ncbi:MAG: winged helix-turn-helix transcriptional regulator [Marinomonas sp.]